MTLKIVRGLPVVRETRLSPMKAREVCFKCSECKRTSTVQVPWDATGAQRQDLIRMVLDEHRRIGCTVKDSSARRTYEIWYPRG